MKSILNIAGVIIALSALSALITGGTQVAVGVATVKANRQYAKAEADLVVAEAELAAAEAKAA
jgi:hypothetical protein